MYCTSNTLKVLLCFFCIIFVLIQDMSYFYTVFIFQFENLTWQSDMNVNVI